jgi:hypothetical protein
VRELRSRTRSQAPPAWAMFDALSDPVGDQARREWLRLEDGELLPQVVRADRPSLVIWTSPWPDRPDDLIRFDIEDHRLTWTLLGDAGPADEPRLDQLRYRLDVIINSDLRHSFGQ